MNVTKRIVVDARLRSIGWIACGLFLFASPAAKATFIIDPNPGGVSLFIDNAKAVTSFSGHVGGNNVGPIVNVVTDVKVDTASGNATIKPDTKDLILTTLTFTPENPLLFGDFSFRGQLDNAGTITVTVVDQLGVSQSFDFNIEKANQDFDRIGIVSTDTETIKSVTITNTSFKEVKLMDFSFNPTAVPEPSTLLSAGIAGLVGLGYGWSRRRKVGATG